MEIARAARETAGRAISAPSFPDEQGRCGATTGSAVWTGLMTLAKADAEADIDGIALADARMVLGHRLGAAVDPKQFTGFIELHIEQGPSFQVAGEQIGVVTDIAGYRQDAVTLTGQQTHAVTIDELGCVPLSRTGAELLFDLISQRYVRRATLITRNLPFDDWTEIFGFERLTGAHLDRPTDRLNILQMNGEIYRLGQSKDRQDRA